MPDLAELIGGPTSQLALRQATVTAIPTPGLATLAFGRAAGTSYPAGTIAGVRMLAQAAASVVANDVVWVLQNGYDMLVIGKVGAAVDAAYSGNIAATSIKVTNNSAYDPLWVTGDHANLRLDGRDGGGFTALYSQGSLFHVWLSAGGVDVALVGQTVNGTEWGIKSNYNLQGNEVYSNGWFRSLMAGTGWYSQAHGRGIFMEDSSYVKVYGGAEFWAPSNKIRAQMARFGESGPWADHVCYSHNNYQQDGNDGFMQRWDGWAWWRSTGQLGFTSRGSDIAWMDSSGGWCDFRPNLVGLGGDPVVIAGSNQLGRGSSSIRWKDRIGNLLGTDDSPVWKLQPVRYLWKQDEDGIHPSRHEVNARHPKGLAGFIAEEVAEVAPDAVNYDGYGQPSSIESWTMLAYVVAGLQHLKDRIDKLEGTDG